MAPSSGSWIEEGDVILEVDQKPIKALDEFNRKMESYKQGDTLLLLVKRGKPRFFDSQGALKGQSADSEETSCSANGRRWSARVSSLVRQAVYSGKILTFSNPACSQREFRREVSTALRVKRSLHLSIPVTA